MKTLALLLTLCVSLTAQAARVSYLPEGEDDITSLDMEPVVPNKKSYQMELFAVNPSNLHTCDFAETFRMKRDKVTFVAQVSEECKIIVKFDDKNYWRASITQESTNESCGCGFQVDISGRVKVKSNNQ